MQAVEPVLGTIATISGLVSTCYGLYQNKKLKKANAITVKALADRLRDISESISEATNSVHAQDISYLLMQISEDVKKIKEHISEVQEQVAKKRLTAMIDAPSIEADLRQALLLTESGQSRLETAQLFIAQACKYDTFIKDWKLLYEKFEKVLTSCDVDKAISNAFQKLNIATKTLVPVPYVKEGLSATTASSIHPDDAEDTSMKVMEGVPAAVKDLVLLASQDRISSSRLRKIVDEFLALWDGWHIHYNDIKYDFIRNRPDMLGSGGFGTVFAGTLTRRNSQGITEHRVAVKEIQIGLKEPTKVLAEIMREALLHMVLEHHCILPCLGVSLPASTGSVAEINEVLTGSNTSEEALTASILTERMSCNVADALQGNMSANRITSVEDKLKIVTDIAKAVCFLHANNVVHRDIKPENVLLNFENGQLKGYAKLSDFGNSRRAHVEQTKKFTSTMSRVQGTPLFMPPEALLDAEGCKTTKAWDIWSYGVLLCYVFAYEAIPTFNSIQIHMFAQGGTLADKMNAWADCISLENIKHVARQCLDANAGRRIEQDPVSVFQLAEKNPEGPRIEKDEVYAAQLKNKAADLGDARAIFNLGACYHRGTGVKKDKVRAAQLYKQAADLGDARAIVYLGVCYEHGAGVEKDEVRATQLYKKAAALGDAHAIVCLGVCYEHGTGMEKDEARAAQLYKQAADLGDARAIFNLGVCYEDAIGMEKDEVHAAQLYKQAADLGDARAIRNLGACYQHAIGLEKDEVHAAQLYKQVAELGDAHAIVNLGVCHEHAFGMEKDEARAAQLYKKAAELSDARAISKLGVCYRRGIGVEKDKARAAQLSKQAADLGYVDATRFRWNGR